jgi:hypothetical protein
MGERAALIHLRAEIIYKKREGKCIKKVIMHERAAIIHKRETIILKRNGVKYIKQAGDNI